MGKIELNISDATLEQLRCSQCKNYLSCPPIRVLPDGTNVCGRCTIDESIQTYIQFSLEAIMRDATFPCKFNENGCKERLAFGYNSIIEHESNCTFKENQMLENQESNEARGSNQNDEQTRCSNHNDEQAGCSNHNDEQAGCSSHNDEQAGCSSQSNKSYKTVIMHDTEMRIKMDKHSVKNPSSVVNPFNDERRGSSASSVINLRQWNDFRHTRRPSTRANSFSGNFNDFPRYGQWNHGVRRRPYHNKRKNNLVIIKGHTLYITL